MSPRLAGLILILALTSDTNAHDLDATVTGQVVMPETCSPSVSPAVVRLEPYEAGGKNFDFARSAGEIHTIDQRGLRFEPRIVALSVGDTLRFGNGDPELHNVHILGKGVSFNRGVPPAGNVDFVPDQPGLLRVVCDIHNHMRAYVVVGRTPWVVACDRTGRFRFRDVPPGRYRLHLWHEMGAPLEREIVVTGSLVDVGALVAPAGENAETSEDREQVCEKGCEPWPMVIDRIALTLASSLEAAQRPDAAAGAVPLAQDAYYRDFEASGMDAAIRTHLGIERSARIGDLFRHVTLATESVVSGKQTQAAALAPTREAILTLVKSSEELNRKGVTERSKIYATTSPAFWVDEEVKRTLSRPGGFGSELASVGVLDLALFLGVAAVTIAGASWVRNETLRALPRRLVLGVSAGLLSLLVLHFPRWLADGETRPAQPFVVNPSAAPKPPQAFDAAPAREHAIGMDVERNALRIGAAWYLAGTPGSQPRLTAHIHAATGNPHGFARGEWVPYLNVLFTLKQSDGTKPVTGRLRPTATPGGPRYEAALGMLSPGEYKLTLRISPPDPSALDRPEDPGATIAPWWEPFEVGFPWNYRPGG